MATAIPRRRRSERREIQLEMFRLGLPPKLYRLRMLHQVANDSRRSAEYRAEAKRRIDAFWAEYWA